MDFENYDRDYESHDIDPERFDELFSGLEGLEEYGIKYQILVEEFMKKPHVLLPEGRDNFEYVLKKADEFAKRKHSRITTDISYEHHEARIELSTFEYFIDTQDFEFFKDIEPKIKSIKISSRGKLDVTITINVKYFHPLYPSPEDMASEILESERSDE